MEEIKQVAVIGLGAIGAGYTNLIAENNKEAELYGIVRRPEIYRKSPILVNGRPLQIPYCSYKDLCGIKMDLILVAVKSYNLQEVVEQIKPLLGEHTVVLSLLNGINSEEIMREALGDNHVLYATITGADANKSEEKVSFNKPGCLYFGEKTNRELTDRVAKVGGFLKACKIPFQVPPDMEYKLWDKFLVNAGCNQTSVVFQMNYEQLRTSPEAMDCMRAAQREIIALANKKGIGLTEDNIIAWEEDLQGLTSDGRSSMLQDLWQGRPLEMDILGDYICRLGKEEGVSTPVNENLRERIYQMIQERNAANRGYAATPDKIATQLRLDILQQRIKKGDKIAENQLSQRFSASRNSVRTALQILSSEGLIITHSNGRREAVEFTERQVVELYQFRWMIEQEALKVIMEKKVSMFPLMAQVLQKIEIGFNAKDNSTDWYDLDVRFHRALVQTSENMFLINAWESNAQLIYTLMSFNTSKGYGTEYAETFFEKHKRLYELFLREDTKGFEELKKHIMDAEIISKEVLQESTEGK